MKIISFIITLFFLAKTPAYALSEYGLVCADNEDCVECNEDPECLTCQHNCWNMFGNAESNRNNRPKDKKEACILKRAKWCNAQCWDPDDRTEEDYVSSVPPCDDWHFPHKRKGKKW